MARKQRHKPWGFYDLADVERMFSKSGDGESPAERPKTAIEVAREFKPRQVGLGSPTSRPDEPVVAGLGAPLPQFPVQRDPDVALLAAYVPALEQLANLDSTPAVTRNLIRRLRGSMP